MITDGVSPQAVTVYKEDESAGAFLNGDAIFLRNWPYVYARGVQGREYNRLDYALVTLRFEGGAIAHVEGHWGYPGPFNYSIEVAGSRAVLSANSTEPATLDLISSRAEAPDLASGESPYERELAHFLRCISTGEEPVVKADDAYEALSISIAAAESIVKGEPVTLGGQP